MKRRNNINPLGSVRKIFLIGIYLCALYYLLPYRPAYLIYQWKHNQQGTQTFFSFAATTIKGERFPTKSPNRFDFLFFLPIQSELTSIAYQGLSYQLPLLSKKALYRSKSFLSFRGPPVELI